MPLELRRPQKSLSLEVILGPYGSVLRPACRCVDCESRRAARLAQALRKKFAGALRPPGERNER
jgi:hypothetical protein